MGPEVTVISVEKNDNAETFLVRVDEGGLETEHRVEVPVEFAKRFSAQFSSSEKLVHASFAFLLQREPPSSILRSFALPDISRYFSEYEKELQDEGSEK